LLSMASSQLELKSIPGAKKTLGELIAKYPSSPAAASAKARLEALK
jgi:TolA-binding protein